MSARTWSQGGQSQGMGVARPTTNPPPICFNCSQEGHFMIACPEAPRQNPINNIPFPVPPAAYQQYPAPAPPQPYQLQPDQPQQPQGHYRSYPQSQQYGASPQAYPYAQAPPSQAYSAPPVAHPQNRPSYQPQPHSQYHPGNGIQQYDNTGYQNSQQYVHPGVDYHQSPVISYQPQNPGYHGPPTYSAPSQHWINSPSSPQVGPAYQYPSRSHSQSQQRDFSGNLNQLANTQREQGSEGPRPHSQTPGSNFGNFRRSSTIHEAQSSPVIPKVTSQASSRASTPYGRRGSAASSTSIAIKRESGTPADFEEQRVTKPKNADHRTDEEIQFNWEFKYIFKSPPKPETVGLAQPLSTTFDMTPVPLVDTRTIRSVSRYARNENVNEFMRSIRVAPQWSYLQEDPAFSDSGLDGPLIPLHEIPAWIAQRHGILEIEEKVEETLSDSRKRAWSQEQNDIDHQIKLEAGPESENENHPGKRQKNEETEGQDDVMVERVNQQDTMDRHSEHRLTTPQAGTPVLGRSGTPCLANVDDAWAPSPGERACTPEDPTEMLLASLGVTGTAKPVQNEPLPPYVVPFEDQIDVAVAASQPQTISNTASNVPSLNTPRENEQYPPPERVSSHENRSQSGPINNQQTYANNVHDIAPKSNLQVNPLNSQGVSSNSPYIHSQHNVPHQQYETQVSSPYQSIPHQVQFGNPQYGPPQGAAYGGGNGPPLNAHYSGPYHGATQYGAVQTAPSQHMIGQPPSSQVSQWGSPQYNYGSPQSSQYGPPQFANTFPPNSQYGAPQYTSPQFGAPQLPYQGPLQYVNGYPIQNTQYPSNDQPQYQNGPPINQPNANQALRQDSGYASARESFNNGPGPNGYYNQPPYHPTDDQRQQQSQTQHTVQLDRGDVSLFQKSSGQNAVGQQATAQHGDSRQGDNQQTYSAPEVMERKNSQLEESGSTPLSPTSLEILGKLADPSDKQGFKKDSGLAMKGDSAAKRAKRPQPVVAEAYSRRW